MTNIKKEDIIDFEKKILMELKKNCRTNIDDIAKKCGCSRYKVGRFMKRMENNFTILGYTAVVNPNKEKLKHYIVLIKRSSAPVDEKILKKLPVQKLSDIIPGVDIDLKDTQYLNGGYDWITTFTTDDIFNAKEYCNKIQKMYGKYVEKVDLLEVVTQVRINGYRVPQTEKITNIL